MENQDKKVDITPAPAAPAAEKKEVVTTPESPIDYKALLEVEKAEKEKTIKQLGQAEFTIEKLKKESKEDPDVPDLDVETIDESARKAAREEAQKYFAEQSKDVLDEALEGITDPDKRELVKFHLENSIVRSGFSKSAIVKDISKAVAIVDAPRVKAEKKELEHAIASKDSRGPVNSAGQDISKDTVKLSEAEEKQVVIIASRTGKSVEVVRAKMIANKSN